MRRREFISLLGGAAAAWPLAARAQQSERMRHIGVLSAGPVEPTSPSMTVLPDALRLLGWTEGKNVTFERRYADNRVDRLPELAAQLIHLNVDLIFGIGSLAPLAAKQATTKIPIVMGAAGDPVGSGLVVSLARPGGNVTGMSLMATDLGGKRLELLKEILPRLARVAVLWNVANQYAALVFKEAQRAGQNLGIQVQSLEARGLDDIHSAFQVARRERADGLIVVEDPLTFSHRKLISDLAAEDRLPAVHGFKEFVIVGGLMSYGANLEDLYRGAAGYVDKILRGAKPADLPVQQPTKFDLVINLQTVKALGLEVPATLLARADEVIE